MGFPAIDLIEENNYASEDEVTARLGLELEKPVILFTQHSVSTEFGQAVKQVVPALRAMQALAATGMQIVLTYPNNDAGGRAIIGELETFAKKESPNIQLHRSLGRYLYHGVLALAQNPENKVACVGNSSSGLKETPAFACPTVNIGSRQAGRLRGKNVLDSEYDSEAIIETTRRCLFDDQFRALCRKSDNPYYLGGAGPKVAKILSEISLDQALIRKRMTLKGEIREGWYR